MLVLLDNVTPYRDSKGRLYYQFAVRFMVASSPFWVSVSGWRYWPDTYALSTPSLNKGNGKYFNMVKVPPETYTLVQDKIEILLGIERVVEIPTNDEETETSDVE